MTTADYLLSAEAKAEMMRRTTWNFRPQLEPKLTCDICGSSKKVVACLDEVQRCEKCRNRVNSRSRLGEGLDKRLQTAIAMAKGEVTQ